MARILDYSSSGPFQTGAMLLLLLLVVVVVGLRPSPSSFPSSFLSFVRD